MSCTVSFLQATEAASVLAGLVQPGERVSIRVCVGFTCQQPQVDLRCYCFDWYSPHDLQEIDLDKDLPLWVISIWRMLRKSACFFLRFFPALGTSHFHQGYTFGKRVDKNQCLKLARYRSERNRSVCIVGISRQSFQICPHFLSVLQIRVSTSMLVSWGRKSVTLLFLLRCSWPHSSAACSHLLWVVEPQQVQTWTCPIFSLTQLNKMKPPKR